MLLSLTSGSIFTWGKTAVKVFFLPRSDDVLAFSPHDPEFCMDASEQVSCRRLLKYLNLTLCNTVCARFSAQLHAGIFKAVFPRGEHMACLADNGAHCNYSLKLLYNYMHIKVYTLSNLCMLVPQKIREAFFNKCALVQSSVSFLSFLSSDTREQHYNL